MNKNQLMITTLLLLFLTGCTFLPPTSAGPELSYVVDGDTVYVNDSKAYISATPHTLRNDGGVDITLMTKAYTGDVNILVGFNTSEIKPLKVERLVTATANDSLTCDTSTGGVFNYSPSTAYCYDSTETLLWSQDYDAIEGGNNTIFYTIDYEQALLIGNNPGKVSFTYDGKDTWYYFLNVPLVANESKRFRLTMDLLSDDAHKYDLAVYPSSYGTSVAGLQNAVANGHVYVLDPWTDGFDTNRSAYYISRGVTGWGAGSNITLKPGDLFDAFVIPLYQNGSLITYTNGQNWTAEVRCAATGNDFCGVGVKSYNFTTKSVGGYMCVRRYSTGTLWFLNAAVAWVPNSAKAWTLGSDYYVKAQYNGTHMKCKLWSTGSAEPGSWDINVAYTTAPYNSIYGVSVVNEQSAHTTTLFSVNYTGATEPSGPANNAPNITGLTFEYDTAFEGSALRFYCAAEDPDNDYINISWTITKNLTIPLANGSTPFVPNGTNASVYNGSAEANYNYTLCCTPTDNASSPLSGSQQCLYSGVVFAPVVPPNPAQVCPSASQLLFYANISRGTIIGAVNYTERDILPFNNSVCGYTYVLNNTGAGAAEYTVYTNFTSSVQYLTVDGTNISLSANKTFVVGAGTKKYVNITLSYVNFPLINPSVPFTLNWTAVFS